MPRSLSIAPLGWLDRHTHTRTYTLHPSAFHCSIQPAGHTQSSDTKCEGESKLQFFMSFCYYSFFFQLLLSKQLLLFSFHLSFLNTHTLLVTTDKILEKKHTPPWTDTLTYIWQRLLAAIKSNRLQYDHNKIIALTRVALTLKCHHYVQCYFTLHWADPETC